MGRLQVFFLAIIALVLLNACDTNTGNPNIDQGEDEFSIKLKQDVVEVLGGGSAYLDLELEAPAYIGETVVLKVVDLEHEEPLDGLTLLPSSFVIEQSPVSKRLELRLDKDFPYGKFDLQIIISISNVEKRLLFSLLVERQEPLQISASLRPAALAVFQGEEVQTILSLELNREGVEGQAQLSFKDYTPGLEISPSSLELVSGEIELSIKASIDSPPGLYKTTLLLKVDSNEDEGDTKIEEIPASILVVALPKAWTTVSAPIEELEACGEGFVAVGRFGELAWSADGRNWQFYSSPGLSDISSSIVHFVDVACGNNKLVLISEDSSNAPSYVYVTDLPLSGSSEWRVQTLASHSLDQIEFGRDIFVIRDYGDGFYISDDADEWRHVSIPWNPKSVKFVPRGGGFWISAGWEKLESGAIAEVVYESRDHWQTWQRRWAATERDDKIEPGNIISDGSFVVIFGRLGKYLFNDLSVNGWAVRPYSDEINLDKHCKGIDYKADGDVWVACGGTELYVTSSGRSWRKVDVGAPLRHIAYSEETSTAVAAPSVGEVYVSWGGGTWEGTRFRFASALPGTMGLTDSYFTSITYGGGVYVAVGRYGTISVSEDGTYWHPVQIGFSDTQSVLWKDVVYSPDLDRFVVVGSGGDTRGGVVRRDGYIAWADAGSWNGQELDWNLIIDQDSDFNSVTWGRGEFVATGDNGWIFRSSDGISWDKRRISGDNLYDIATNDGKALIATTPNGIIYSMDGGYLWNELEITDMGYGRICFDGNEFFLFRRGRYVRSKDGKEWTAPAFIFDEHGNKAAITIENVSCISGLKLVVGFTLSSSPMYASTDGESWRALLPLGNPYTLLGGGYLNGNFYAVGQLGAVLRTMALSDGEN